MKKNIFSILIFAVLSFSTVFSQGTLVQSSAKSQSLIFNLIGLNDLKAGAFEGGIGYQIFMKNNLAGRISVGISNVTEKKYPISADTSLVPEENSNFSFTISPAIKYIFSKNTTVEAYIGAEGNYGVSKIVKKNVDFINNASENISSSRFIGGSMILGVEWFAWENVSLGAEYKLSFTKSLGETENKSKNYDEKYNLPETTTIGLGTSNYVFALSFYF